MTQVSFVKITESYNVCVTIREHIYWNGPKRAGLNTAFDQTVLNDF